MIVPEYTSIASSANRLANYLDENSEYIQSIYGEEVYEEMLKARELLDKSYIYVKRINALTSGLEPPKSFLTKLKLDLEEY